MDEFSKNHSWPVNWYFGRYLDEFSRICLDAILIGCDFFSYSQISTFMKWLFFDKCEKVKLLPHQRNIYFYRLKFPIRKFDNDLGYFRKTFEAVHQAIRGSRTNTSLDDMVHPDGSDLHLWRRALSRGWLMI